MNTEELIGKKITKVWRGGASVIFIELDEYKFMIEGDWVLKKSGVLVLHNFDSAYSEMEEVFKGLVGLSIKRVGMVNNKTFALVFENELTFEVCNRDGFWLTLFKDGKETFSLGGK